MNKTTILIVASSLLLMTLVGCKEKERQEVKCVHSVMVTTPAVSNGAQAKNFSGVVQERQNISLGFKTAGEILKVFVKEGDRVRQGQILATLDAKDYQLAVDAAQTQYDQIYGEVERLKKLYEGKALSSNDYEKATSGLEQARINLQSKKNLLDYTTLRSPVNGLVQKVNFEPSEQVSAGLGVVELLNVSRMEIEINIPSDVYRLRDRFGDVYGIVNEERYPLTQVSMKPRADANQLFTIRYSIDAPVQAGESVDVYIDIAPDSSSRGLTVPSHAIFEYDGSPCVYVVDKDDIVHRREVVIGQVDKSGQLIITSGLDPDDRVVRTGGSVLSDGEKVTVITYDKSNVGGLL